ncbi:MAG: 50S ribosome-binding GTPase [Caldilineaceae bacterium]|nr:50S ribosome-binding GTPase [Caldilineaceae bacterium]
MAKATIALAGNPNVGKSTVFNALTGSRQHVGNWPGKTVARKEGIFTHHSHEITIVDLPGTYSLSAYSLEEQIARDYLVDEHPRVVVNVVDAANLERNLYLTAQLLETGIPLILVLNMQDQANARGIQIDTDRLSAMLGSIPVLPMTASRGQGFQQLKEAIVTQAVTQAVKQSMSLR